MLTPMSVKQKLRRNNKNVNMKQYLIYDNSWRFSKCAAATLSLIAFLIQNPWLVLIAALLMALGIFSVKFNIPYQLHTLFLGKLLKKKLELIWKESGELSFVSSMGGTLFFVGFLFLYFGKLVGFAWFFILITSFLMFLGCLTYFCLAASMYIFFKKILKLR